MSYQNTLHCVAQPITGIGVRQHLRRRRAWSLPGGSALWLAAAKIALGVFIATAAISLGLGRVAAGTGEQLQLIEAQRHEIKNQQILLLAERANLMSAAQVLKLAEAKLALFVPEEGQIHKLR